MSAGGNGHALAERIRLRLIAQLEEAYEDAAMQGLCGEGALEYAIGRVRDTDAATLLADAGDDGTAASDHPQGED